MKIRHAGVDDLERIKELFDIGRQTMRDSGNAKQWINGYPSEELIRSDIDRETLYVLEDEAGIHGVFFFQIGQEPAYKEIYRGQWLNDEPYGTIHRIASDGTVKGILGLAKDFALEQIANIRIDTHADNSIMRHVLTKNGFTECGTIVIEDGSERVAYQFCCNQ